MSQQLRLERRSQSYCDNGIPTVTITLGTPFQAEAFRLEMIHEYGSLIGPQRRGLALSQCTSSSQYIFASNITYLLKFIIFFIRIIVEYL